ncbi:disease resistance-like protein DSC2 isoform X2 [Capsella rubella]|uniref:disease resistance-like protein DSC2 isoform X2 n=1 Tax=Capsella rubella TaxID=81985 RepID=UPI000CD59A40|nr:disease resistance-like protein DSC2 isoform X2 [Capsella rubella]
MASSSASRTSDYDVFLSFRGEDTRHSIVSHLYAALASRGIVTFKDDKRLELGDHISEELHRAIEGSNFVVVVLSENYPSSRWCLMELQMIMKHQVEGRIGVFPVFYRVDPSAVRHQQGSFDLEGYERDPQMADKVPKWRESLKMIADLSGVASGQCIDEATMVRKIVEDISRRKAMMHKIDFRNIVGVDTHMEGLTSLLDMDSNNDEVRMIGIWGMGGIGKTAIAKCLYDQLSSHFTTRYFTEDIKGIYKDLDLLHLQNKLLYNTLGDDITPWSVEAGREVIATRLGNHKVLLVLDGVDNLVQIHALAKETRWFGCGSRIIITTRDRGMLNSCGVKAIYGVQCLDDMDSLQMFKQIAFEGGSPSAEFDDLSIRAAQLAHGLPSAIQAYALFLRGRANSPEEWEEAVCGLESTPDENIMEILKISYEGLAKPHQNAFLHVACLFNGDTYRRVTSLLVLSRRESNLWMRVLAEKSLINITSNGFVILHKLVEQMGREIMLDSGKFIGDPEKIHDALDYREGIGQTESISLHTCEMKCPFSMETGVFGKMYKLRFVKVYKHVDDRESRLQVIPDDVYPSMNCTLLHWDAFPLRTLPLMFNKYGLVELILRHSNLETLWSGVLKFSNLKKLDVTGSKNLKQLPDLSCSEMLDELMIEQCKRLKGIPESIGEKSSLSSLNLSYYGGPRSPLGVVIGNVSHTQHITLEFPTARVEMQLKNILITGDIKFRVFADCEGYAEYFSFRSEQKIHGTKTVSVHQAPRIISDFKNSTSLNIRRFSYRENSRPVTFQSFPHIPGLEDLKLVNLNIQKLSDAIGHFEFLEKLDFSGNDFESLPEDMNRLSRLKTLCLRNCSKLKELPELTQVQSLTLSNCRSLRSLVKRYDASQDPGIYCLLELCLDNCKNVKSLSDQLSHFPKLTFLDLSSHDFKTLPSSIRDLTSLVTICLNNCKKLKSLEELPLSLQFLDTEGCDSLDADALEHFKGRLNKEVPSRPDIACFQETEMLSYEQDHEGSKSRLPKFLCCSHF